MVILSLTGIGEIARFFTGGTDAMYPGNGPLSTVGVEMMLYVSYPVFLLIYSRLGLIALLGVGASSYSIIAFVRYAGVHSEYLHATYFEFVLYWVIGAASAEAFMACGKCRKRIGLIMVVTLLMAFVYFLVAYFAHLKGVHVICTLLLAIITGGALISLMFFENTHKEQANYQTTLLANLGERSYSLYAVHTPVIFLSMFFLKVYCSAFYFKPWLVLFVTLLAAEGFYRFIERPSHLYTRQLRLFNP